MDKEKDNLDLNNPAEVLTILAQEQIEELGRGILKIYHAMNKRMAELKRMSLEEARERIQEHMESFTREDYEKVTGATGTTEEKRAGFIARAREVARQMFEINMLVDLHPQLNKELDLLIEERAALLYPPKAEPLPPMPKRPQRHISPNNKLMNVLASGSIINAGPVNLQVFGKDNPEITTYVVATYEHGGDKEIADAVGRLSQFERNVSDAVCSIVMQARAEGMSLPIPITPTSIYKAMPGGGDHAKKAMLERIAAAFTKMKGININLDATQELVKAKKIKKGEKYIVESPMFLAKKHIYQRTNGTTLEGWRLYDDPVVLEYAEMMGQLVNVPAKIMQIEGIREDGTFDGWPIRLTDTRRDLLAYFVRRVAVIKRDREEAEKQAAYKKNVKAGKTWKDFAKQSPVILYETAFKEIEVENLQNRHTVKDCKDFCRLILGNWVLHGYIAGFKEVKKGRETRGLEIIF